MFETPAGYSLFKVKDEKKLSDVEVRATRRETRTRRDATRGDAGGKRTVGEGRRLIERIGGFDARARAWRRERRGSGTCVRRGRECVSDVRA